MCRILAAPPGTTQKEALEIMSDLEKDNTDGFGYAYVHNNQFIVNKWPKSFSFLQDRKLNLFQHMPYDGWTIAHVRAASYGCLAIENTHPFVAGNWCVIHNGTWNDHKIARLALGKTVKLIGDTDSEVAAHLIKIAGPRKFAECLDWGGVFLALNRSGTLWAIKISGDLVYFPTNDKKILLASELDKMRYAWAKQNEISRGWYLFGKDGKLIAENKKESSYVWKNGSYQLESSGMWKGSFNGRALSPEDSLEIAKYGAV